MTHQKYLQAVEQYQKQQTESTRTALFHALLPYLKNAASAPNPGHFTRTMAQMEKFGFHESKKFANQIVWAFVSLMSKLRNYPQFLPEHFIKIFNSLKKLNHNKPSKEHSLLLKFFLKRADHFNHFDAFVKWWDTDNFRPEDYQPETFKNITYPALVESFYGTQAKILIRQFETSPNDALKTRLSALIEILGKLYKTYPRYKFFPYYMAKIKLAINGPEGILEEFAPFAQKNATQFWIWEFLAGLFKTDQATHLALLCRAALCKADPEMKINLHANLAEAFALNKQYDAARTEIETVVGIREKHRWKIPANIRQMKASPWFAQAKAVQHQTDLYRQLASGTDHILFGNAKKCVALITGYSPKQKRAWYLTEKFETGSFKPASVHLKHIEPFTLVRVFLQNNAVVKAEKTTMNAHDQLIKTVSGKLKIFAGKTFGMLHDVFVPGEIIRQEGLADGQFLSVRAVRSFNKKKNKWGWKVNSILETKQFTKT